MAQVTQSTKLNKYHKLILDLLSSRQPLEVIEPAIQDYYAMLPDAIQAQVIQDTEFHLHLLREAYSLDNAPLPYVEAAPVAALEAPAPFTIIYNIEPETLDISRVLPASFNIEMPSYYAENDPTLGAWAVHSDKAVNLADWALFRKLARQNSTNYIPRDAALKVIQNAHKYSKRHATRLLRQGNGFFWDYDESAGRYYLRAEHVIAVRLAALLPYELVQDNLPGKRRYDVDCSGSSQQINAEFNSLYLFSKAEYQNGRIYRAKREILSNLFNAIVPTMLEWEQIAGVQVRRQYERSADISIDNVPKHAYLRAGDNGEVFAEWQGSNAYYPQEYTSRAHRGSSSKTRNAVLEYLQTHQPDSNGVGDTEQSVSTNGLQKLGPQVFEGNTDNWAACEKHVRQHQDPNTDHYYVIAEEKRRLRRDKRRREMVSINERFNPVTKDSASKMTGVKVDYEREHSAAFKALREAHAKALLEASLC